MATERRLRGLTRITIATVIAGLGGYAITIVVARGLGADAYASFAVFWGALYLFIGALAGIQQELTRATRRVETPDLHARRLVAGFVGVGALAVTAIIGLVVLALVPIVFPEQGWPIVIPIAIGSGLSVIVAALTGALYGLHRWSMLATVIVLDVALRLAIILVTLLLGGDVLAVAWATVAPVPVVAMVLLFSVFRAGAPSFGLDVGARQLFTHVLSTVGAAVGQAVLVSGFPLFVGLAAHGEPDELVGSLVFALVLTRAPLVVVMLALQSYLVVRLRDHGHLARTVSVISIGLVVVGVVLAVAAFLIGEPVLVLLAGPEFAVQPWVLAAMTLASVATGLLTLSGAAALARRRHALYVAGWTIAAAVAVVLLFVIPAGLELRLVLALAVGPVVGYVIHLAGLRRKVSPRSARPAAAPAA
jgi:O-antigen/teichoic acid export membrane protein